MSYRARQVRIDRRAQKRREKNKAISKARTFLFVEEFKLTKSEREDLAVDVLFHLNSLRSSVEKQRAYVVEWLSYRRSQ